MDNLQNPNPEFRESENNIPVQLPEEVQPAQDQPDQWDSPWQMEQFHTQTMENVSYVHEEEIPEAAPVIYGCETEAHNATAEAPGEATTPGKPRKKKPLSRHFWQCVAWVLILASALAIGCVVTGTLVDLRWQKRMSSVVGDFEDQLADLRQQVLEVANRPTVSIGNSGTPAEGLSPAQVYALNVNAVVMIQSSNRVSYSTGSGFILSEDGYVVTNHHVIEGGETLRVITSDGKEHPAKLVGSDSTNDVALLKIEAKGLQAVVLGSSSDLVVGDQVVAIGNPLGELTSTLTVGYVSAMERDVNTDGFAINMLQTDAAINSGNSGGPLFNMRGEVVGITTAKYSGTSSSGASIEGVGFAIPIDDVRVLLDDLKSYGYITGAYMGVRVSDMDLDAASYYGLPVGAYVTDTEIDSPARNAGIRSKDIIVKLGDFEIGSVNDLTRALRNFEAGDQVTVTLYRSGREMKVTVVLVEKPAQ